MDTQLDLQFEELESMEALWDWTQFGTAAAVGAGIVGGVATVGAAAAGIALT
ncbi:hypothetical protein ABZ499_11080 [Streptomyces sp. NPDC019990]|uniref:hypothetical protein n=1 Tax=Streptomyces sp. NPDC019990 TaxID=3154693 RepID=UPI0033D020F6